MSDALGPEEQAVAVCAVGGGWSPTSIAEMTVTNIDPFQPTRTVEAAYWEEPKEITRTKTRSPGCSRCNGTGTVFYNREERPCPGCTENYTVSEETTQTGVEQWVETDYDLREYPEPVQGWIEDAEPEVLSQTRRAGGPESANIAHSDRETTHTVTRTEGVSCATLTFIVDKQPFSGYRVDGNYYLKQQPEVSDADGLVSSVLSNGPSITVRPSPLEVVDHQATGYVDCDQCTDSMIGVVDDEGTIHGICLACGHRVMDAGWVDPDRAEESTAHEKVTNAIKQIREL